MKLIQIQDHLEAVIAPARVREIWSTAMGVTADVPVFIPDEQQSPIAIATGAHQVNLVRYRDHTLVFLEI